MLERLYWFYTRLKQNTHPTAAQYAEQFELSRSTFKRDLAYMRDRLGAPVAYDREKNGYFLTDASFEMPAFWFNRMHLTLMMGVCRQLAAMAEESPEIRAFRERIETLLSCHYGDDVQRLISFENVEWSRCDTDLFDTLLIAAVKRRFLRLHYLTGHSGERNVREVEPYRIHNYRGTWHLVGFCHHRGKPRVFMLSRIERAEPLDRCFDRPRFDVTAFLDNTFGIYKGAVVRQVTLRFSPAIARIIRDEIWHRDQRMTDLEGGGLLLTLPVSDLTEIRRHVLKYGGDVEVLEPGELRHQVVREAESILKIYGK